LGGVRWSYTVIAQLQGRHFSLSEVCKLLPNRPNVSTIWRWARVGCRGQKLSVVKIGGVTYVSEAELERFLTACNGSKIAVSENFTKSRKKRLAKVAAELNAELG
jgi:hypothetical protein